MLHRFLAEMPGEKARASGKTRLVHILALALTLSLVMSGCAGGAMPASSWAGLTVKDGVAYLAATDRLIAVDTTDGTTLWTYQPIVVQASLFGSGKAVNPIHAEPAIYDESVFIGSDGQPRDDGHVRALDATLGQLLWQFPPEGQPPLGNIFAGLAADQQAVYCAAGEEVYALQAESGQVLWKVSAGGRVWGQPLPHDDILYISTINHKVLALDTSAQGRVLWEFSQAQGAIAGSPLLAGDTLYIGAFDKKLYALDAQTGQERWSYPVQGWIWDGLTVVGDQVFVGDTNGYVYALNVGDGQPHLAWTQPVKIEGAVRAAPFYMEANGDQPALLIVTSDVGRVYALDPQDGSVQWVALAPSGRLLTSPRLDNGVLLLATLSGPVQLYGLDPLAMPEAYQQQEIAGSERAPVKLYQEDQVNTQVVRWHIAPAKK